MTDRYTCIICVLLHISTYFHTISWHQNSSRCNSHNRCHKNIHLCWGIIYRTRHRNLVYIYNKYWNGNLTTARDEVAFFAKCFRTLICIWKFTVYMLQHTVVKFFCLFVNENYWAVSFNLLNIWRFTNLDIKELKMNSSSWVAGSVAQMVKRQAVEPSDPGFTSK